MSQPDPNSTEATDRNREPGSSLAKAPDLQQNYDQAQQATEPLEEPTPAPKREPITLAQETDPIKALADRTDQAQQPTPLPTTDSSYLQSVRQLADQHRAGEPFGSQMVKDQAPAPRPSNTMPEAKIQDAQTFDQKWKDEQSQAAAFKAEIKDLAADLQQNYKDATQQQQGQGQGH